MTHASIKASNTRKSSTKLKRNSSEPKSQGDIADKILHYGAFKDALDYMVDYLQSPMSSSLILRGNPGTGKKSLIKEACKTCNVTPIYLNPFHYHDDHYALRRVALEIGLKHNKPSLQDLIHDIEERTDCSTEKIVLVLLDFQEFCRQKQSFLYCLTTLTQHGKNISLIGITHSLDCTNGLEKRVRSRINARFYNMGYPFTNFNEYLEFASQLLGGHKFEGKNLDQLKWMYQSGCYEIPVIKRFLISICSWDYKEGYLEVCQQEEPVHNPKADMRFLTERLKSLTRNQLDTLKLAVYYCNNRKAIDFTFEKLLEQAKNSNFESYVRDFQLSMRDVEPLEMTFIKMAKPNESLSMRTLFYINIMPDQLRLIIETNPELQSIQTDSFWRSLPSVSGTRENRDERLERGVDSPEMVI